MKKIVLFWIMMLSFTTTFSMPRGQKKHMKRLNAPHRWKLERDLEPGIALQQQIQHTIPQAPTHKKQIAQQAQYDHQHNNIEHFVIQ